jgi:hypothetical protein
MIDLHMHTTCSDGSDDWKTILSKAEALGIKVLSITDHNNCDVYALMENPERYFLGRIIKGIEPECMYRGRLIELMGYGIDTDKMTELLRGVYPDKMKVLDAEYKMFYDACVKAGIKFSEGIFEKLDRRVTYYGGCHLHADMIKYPENKKIVTDDESWGNSIQFFRKWGNNPRSPLNVDLSGLYPDTATIVSLIKQAGGLVFIPHIFLYGDDSIPFLQGLTSEFEIDGIECFYNSFTKEQTDYLLKFCKEHRYLVSGGSDYHGSGRPHITLGVKDERLSKLIGWADNL